MCCSDYGEKAHVDLLNLVFGQFPLNDRPSGKAPWVLLTTRVLCGRVGSSHTCNPAFGQGAEYPMKPLQWSCMKLKLHTRPAPCTAIQKPWI